jgi:hypothetical protein
MSGRVLDLEKAKGKLSVIEHEFRQAELSEFWRQKEEEEMRVRARRCAWRKMLIVLYRFIRFVLIVGGWFCVLCGVAGAEASWSVPCVATQLAVAPGGVCPVWRGLCAETSVLCCLCGEQDRVQKKRFEALERAKREERILRIRVSQRHPLMPPWLCIQNQVICCAGLADGHAVS